jgi:hypothetical protein
MKRWSLKARNARSPLPPRSLAGRLIISIAWSWGPAPLLIAPGLVGQPLCGFGEGYRPPAAELLTVLQPDLERYPDGQRMRSKRLVRKGGGQVAVDGICQRGAE